MTAMQTSTDCASASFNADTMTRWAAARVADGDIT